ncbi:MAG: NAD-dependent succinate-semialdehyde dehydrogenase [Acidobacteria bacterium]|nr:NAD-dependent succinate-semialdehyde dehydrogenase [Acidobacteriota bacterium]
MAIRSVYPATGHEIKSFAALTAEQIEAKLELAAQAFRDYATVPVAHRALCMHKLAALIDEETEGLASTMVQEMGKTIGAARQELAKCANAFRFYADNGERMMAPEMINTEHGRSYVQWQPLGVILAIMPWNFPFWQVVRFGAPALMAGNIGLLKHATNVPHCAMAIETLIRRAGFPKGVFQALLIENEQVAGIIADARVAAVTLTGSGRAGRAVAEVAGKHLKKCVLELGGSDPFIVMPTADLNAAVQTAVQARVVNNGQSCIAAKRFIVHETVYEEFVRRFAQKMESLRIGDPMREDTEVGPLVSAEAVETLERQVRDAVAAGGRILTGGSRLVGRGFYFEPTVIADLPRTSTVYREELFGPVALVFSARDVNDAVAIANDTPFGLGASLWTRNPAEQQQMVSEIEAGMVFLNGMVASDPRLPFGGIKESGYGRELSAAGMREFMNAKSIVIA